MTITDTRIRLMEQDCGNLKAVASVTFDDSFVVHDIKVINGDKGLFIAMPSKRDGEGNFKDIAHPINSETRSMVQKAVLDKYNAAVSE